LSPTAVAFFGEIDERTLRSFQGAQTLASFVHATWA
jgi:hypothetical protein